nr:hypothetical protein [Tanacetum cinerariifolium]
MSLMQIVILVLQNSRMRWVPTGKIFTYSTTKVDCEPPHGSNADITNPHECKETLDVNAGPEAAESSSCNIDTSNMHTFYQRHRFDYHWTKDHPLKQVRKDPSKYVQTRQQLATNPEMCMFASIEELHQFNILNVWELVDKPFGKNVINLMLGLKVFMKLLLISQLEIHGKTISQEDMHQKFLKSLSQEWNTNTIMWMNKPEIDTSSLDDLHNNLKIYEPEVKGTSNSNINTQNIAFVSSNSISNTNGTVNTAHRVFTASSQVNTINSSNIDNLSDAVICAFLASRPSSPQLVNEDLEQIHPDDLEEMDLKWQMAMLTMRARRFLKKTCMKLIVNGNETIGFDKSIV